MHSRIQHVCVDAVAYTYSLTVVAAVLLYFYGIFDALWIGVRGIDKAI